MRTRLTALGAGVVLLALAGAGTAAVASQRQASSAPVLDSAQRPANDAAETATQAAMATPAPPQQGLDRAPPVAPKTVDLGMSPKLMINGAPVAAGFPYWALAADRVDVQTPDAVGGASLDFILPTTNSPPVYVNGVRLPDGVGLAAIKSELVKRSDRQPDGSIQVQLKPRAPSAARSAESSANKTRLTVGISQVERLPFLLASGDVLRVSLVGETDGVVLATVLEAPILEGHGLPSQVFLDLDDHYFPARMPGGAYELKAEIRRANGQTAYASEPTTLRLAPRSQGRLERMRPELVLSPAS